MKKFLTNITLQVNGPKSYHYHAVGNQRLEINDKTAFPIMTAIYGYTQPGEEFEVIAVVTDNEVGHQNSKCLYDEVQTFCSRQGSGFLYAEVLVNTDERVTCQTDTFQKLIEYVDDNDELFACITYGTKPRAMALLMAVKYAYRIKKNTSISCIVYGQVNRPIEDTKVYDMTALVQMDEIVRVLAEQGVADPKRAIGQILSL